MNWTRRVGVVLGALVLSAGTAFPVAQQIGVGDTPLLFGGIDAQGGIGDWYVSNGVIEAIVDNVGIQADLTPVVGPGNEPPTQTLINPTATTSRSCSRSVVSARPTSSPTTPSARRTRTRSACRAVSSSPRRRWRRRPASMS